MSHGEIPKSEPLAIEPVRRPIRGTVRPPGSKSITNRVLVLSALAKGTSHLSGVLDSDDTRVMVEGLKRLGIHVTQDLAQCTAEVVGCAGRPPAASADLFLENSGTSIRFLTAVVTLGRGTYRLDGNARMRKRPIGDLCAALSRLGTQASCELEQGFPPVRVNGDGLKGGTASVAADVSSQFLSALLMAAPAAASPVELRLSGPIVSEPYVEMTVHLMNIFGAPVDRSSPGCFRIAPRTYRAIDFQIEPDASAASYFFAAAAITGGTVTVPGLSRQSLQGDVRFAAVLEQMGCQVTWGDNSITVEGKPLRGIDIDMSDISDTAQTLAVVAVFGRGPTRIRNIGHVRHKETDRIHAVVTELQRLGIAAVEQEDGLTINPGPVSPATVATYDDHRMAMSFSLIGLRSPGIRIADPGCTAKTYPQFFEDLRSICRD